MKLDTIEDLARLFDLCQRKGIESMKVAGDAIEFKIKDGWAPKKRKGKDNAPDIKDELTPEEAALYWSSAPIEG